MVPTRGSLRSRAAATASALTLRQIRSVLPPEKSWGLWLSRQIVATIMAACGPAPSRTTVAADIRSSGGSCELQIWPDQVHVFQALPRLVPEAAQAMSHVAAFIAESLRANTIDTAPERTG